MSSRGTAMIVVVAAAVLSLAAGVFAIGRAMATDGNPTTVASTGTTAPAGGGGASAAVTVQQFAFSPKSVTVKAGTTVTWTNNDDATHTVKSTDGAFTEQRLPSGGSASVTFAKPGTFSYVCGIHPFMTGTVVVQP
jgi:plastocyanin